MAKNEFGVKLDSNGYALSIMQEDESKCFLCGRSCEKLDRHEPFGGAYRQKSKRLGMWVSLCHNTCHEYGEHSAHRDTNTAKWLKSLAQREAMLRYGWSVSDFRKEFNKSYL